jgi:hypothetical protein
VELQNEKKIREENREKETKHTRISICQVLPAFEFHSDLLSFTTKVLAEAKTMGKAISEQNAIEASRGWREFNLTLSQEELQKYEFNEK